MSVAQIIGPLFGGGFTSNMIDIPNQATMEVPLKKKLRQLDVFGTAFIVPGTICTLLALQLGGQTYSVRCPRCCRPAHPTVASGIMSTAVVTAPCRGAEESAIATNCMHGLVETVAMDAYRQGCRWLRGLLADCMDTVGTNVVLRSIIPIQKRNRATNVSNRAVAVTFGRVSTLFPLTSDICTGAAMLNISTICPRNFPIAIVRQNTAGPTELEQQLMLD